MMPVPAANDPDEEPTQDVRLPLLSKHAFMLARPASAGSRAIVSPGGASAARPVTSVVLSQTSLFWAVRSDSTWLKLRVETPVPSLNCEVRRGRRAPTICAVPGWAGAKVSAAQRI